MKRGYELGSYVRRFPTTNVAFIQLVKFLKDATRIGPVPPGLVYN